MKESWARLATTDDASWIVELSARVQEALTASGSLQVIGPLLLEKTIRSIRTGSALVLQTQDKRLGSVLIDPLESARVVQWALPGDSGPWWYLHSLMLEPEEQGRRLGLVFLEEVKRLLAPRRGAIVLDCWAGNEKLRDFYQRAGFTGQGVFPEKDYEVMVFVCQM